MELMEELIRLLKIIRTLRSPDGCQWDRAQNYESMRPHLIEEAYEVIDAVNRKDFDALREELGDLLYLIHFYIGLAEEENRFTMEDSLRGINEKLIRRHPHVFGDLKVNGVGDILNNWEEIKRDEKESKSKSPGETRSNDEIQKSIMEKTEDFLPALMQANKIQIKAARVGFDWDSIQGVMEKIKEELNELSEEILSRSNEELKKNATLKKQNESENMINGRSGIEEELGDLLFSIVNLSRHLELNPELALKNATEKFIKRFKIMENNASNIGINLRDCKSDILDEFWEKAKIAGSDPFSR